MVLWFAFAVLVSSFVYPVRKVFDCVVYRFCVNSHVLCVVFIVAAAKNYVLINELINYLWELVQAFELSFIFGVDSFRSCSQVQSWNI